MLQLSERTLGDWLEHWAEVTPDKEYIVYSDRNLRLRGNSLTSVWTTWPKVAGHRSEKRYSRRHLGPQCARLADISVCLCQNRCRGRYGQHELQAGRTGIPLRKLRHAYSVYRRRRKGQQLRGNDLHHAARTETLRTGPHEEQTLPSHAQCGVHRSGEIPGYV